jgi:hypothetical protein
MSHSIIAVRGTLLYGAAREQDGQLRVSDWYLLALAPGVLLVRISDDELCVDPDWVAQPTAALASALEASLRLSRAGLVRPE